LFSLFFFLFFLLGSRLANSVVYFPIDASMRTQPACFRK
jgi:hypothetical protein